MLTRRVIASAIACVTIAMAGACGDDSTGPASANLALHFDSLYVASVGGAAHPTLPQQVRELAISELEIPPAFGAFPRVISVQTSTGVERWNGFEFAINPQGSEFASNTIVVAYRELDVHTSLVANFNQAGVLQSARLLVNDSVQMIALTSSGTTSITSQGGSCATPPTLVNPFIVAYQIADCGRGKFLSSMTADFLLLPGEDIALGHIEFGATTLSGEIFTSGFGDSINVMH
jgi:hypothetical protein